MPLEEIKLKTNPSDNLNSKSSEWRAWRGMKQRCYNVSHKSWLYYGGRGIRVCDAWINDFKAFINYIGKKPTPQHTLDRYPNNNGNYEPGNVKWSTRIEQARNRRKQAKRLRRAMRYEFKREPLTDIEKDRMVNACKNVEEKLVVMLLLDTGLREAELVNLKKDNIQWQRDHIVIWGKKDKRRIIPMVRRVKDILDHHFTYNEALGLSISKVYRTVKKVAQRAAIAKKVSPHVLRHTFAMNALQSGVSIVALQKILGHSNIQTTMIYLNMSGQDALEEFQRKVK